MLFDMVTEGEGVAAGWWELGSEAMSALLIQLNGIFSSTFYPQHLLHSQLVICFRLASVDLFGYGSLYLIR